MLRACADRVVGDRDTRAEVFQEFHGRCRAGPSGPAFVDAAWMPDYWIIKVEERSIEVQRAAQSTQPSVGTRLLVRR